MRSADVVVVGAGPAGAAAAVTLARAGRDVVVVDKARFPRDKICGDGLTAGALRLLQGLGLDPAAVPSWQRVDDVVVRGPSGHEVTFPLPRDRGTYAAVARRTDLDAALVEAARAAGAKVLDGHACTGVVETDGEVTATVDGLGEVSAAFLVAADGMWSPVRKHLGLATPGYRGEWHAFRQYFTDVGPRAASELMVWFEPDLLPGYAWSFPLPGNRANVGFGIQRGGKVGRVQDMAAIWPELLARPHVRAVLGDAARPESPHRAWPIPARVDDAVLTGRRTMFVGDAATATDPLTGEGIGSGAAHRGAGGRVGARPRARRGRRGGDLSHGGRPGAGGRPQDVDAADPSRPSPQGRAHRAAPGGRHRVDAAQLRALAVRGLPAGDGGHAPPLAPGDVLRSGGLSRRRRPFRLTRRSSPASITPCSRPA